jgi:hypothetical protein
MKVDAYSIMPHRKMLRVRMKCFGGLSYSCTLISACVYKHDYYLESKLMVSRRAPLAKENQ